jgi:hypothetical protein
MPKASAAGASSDLPQRTQVWLLSGLLAPQREQNILCLRFAAFGPGKYGLVITSTAKYQRILAFPLPKLRGAETIVPI